MTSPLMTPPFIHRNSLDLGILANTSNNNNNFTVLSSPRDYHPTTAAVNNENLAPQQSAYGRQSRGLLHLIDASQYTAELNHAPALMRRHSTIPRMDNTKILGVSQHPLSNNNSSNISGKKLRRRGSGRRSSLPRGTVEVLNGWLLEHLNNPYPNVQEKKLLLELTGLTKVQLSNWFINVRRRKVFNENYDSYLNQKKPNAGI